MLIDACSTTLLDGEACQVDATAARRCKWLSGEWLRGEWREVGATWAIRECGATQLVDQRRWRLRSGHECSTTLQVSK